MYIVGKKIAKITFSIFWGVLNTKTHNKLYGLAHAFNLWHPKEAIEGGCHAAADGFCWRHGIPSNSRCLWWGIEFHGLLVDFFFLAFPGVMVSKGSKYSSQQLRGQHQWWTQLMHIDATLAAVCASTCWVPFRHCKQQAFLATGWLWIRLTLHAIEAGKSRQTSFEVGFLSHVFLIRDLHSITQVAPKYRRASVSLHLIYDVYDLLTKTTMVCVAGLLAADGACHGHERKGSLLQWFCAIRSLHLQSIPTSKEIARAAGSYMQYILRYKLYDIYIYIYLPIYK